MVDFQGVEKSHEITARLIMANEHDLVIESANQVGMAHTYENYLKPNGWKGVYCCINKSAKGESINNLDNNDWHELRGDGLDDKLIKQILDSQKPINPVYIVNDGLTEMQTYCSKKWIGIDLSKNIGNIDGFKKINKVWSKNLRKAGINTCYFANHFKNIKWSSDFLTNKNIEVIKQEWGQNGWSLEEYEFEIADGPKKLLILRNNN